MNFQKRTKKLRKLIIGNGLDSVFLSSPRDILYYTGFEPAGGESFLLVDLKSKPLLFISHLSNYIRNPNARVRFYKDFKDILKWIDGYKSMGFDEKNLSTEFFMRLKKLGIRLKPSGSSIKIPRMIKDEWEIRQIKKAVKLTEKFFREVRFVGKTEQEVSRWIDKKIIDLGLEKAFPPIVASGRNSAFVHYLPGKRRIKKTDLVIADIGVRFNGYCSDMTRTFCMKPDKKHRKVYADVLDIQKRVIDNIRTGTRFDTLENFSENLFGKLGYKKMHSIGHGVGLSVHEGPVSKDTIQNGMVFTVEPGIYIKNWGGCRVEDIVYIKNNRAKLLSSFPRELTP